MKSVPASCNVHPHNQAVAYGGTMDLSIGATYLPLKLLRGVTDSYVMVGQHDPQTNLTMIGVTFCDGSKGGSEELKDWHRARWTQKPSAKGGVVVRLRARLLRSLPHPIPTGIYAGQMWYVQELGITSFLFQLMTLGIAKPPMEQPKVRIDLNDPALQESGVGLTTEQASLIV